MPNQRFEALFKDFALSLFVHALLLVFFDGLRLGGHNLFPGKYYPNQKHISRKYSKQPRVYTREGNHYFCKLQRCHVNSLSSLADILTTFPAASNHSHS